MTGKNCATVATDYDSVCVCVCVSRQPSGLTKLHFYDPISAATWRGGHATSCDDEDVRSRAYFDSAPRASFFSDSRSRPNGIVLEHHYFDLLWAFAVGFGYLQRDQTLYKLYNKSTADRRTQQIEVMTFARK